MLTESDTRAKLIDPAHGLEQAKLYAACKRLNVPFVYSSNGHLFVEFDRLTGKTSSPTPLAEFPSPADLRARYEKHMGFSLDSPAARPLLVRYSGGEATRRYYQDAAIRAVLEKFARGEKRALLALATGSGKTFIAVNLLKRIADAGQLRRALFVCDRDELRAQGLAAFQNVFGADAASVTGDNPQKNARILVATYQTLDVDTDDADANFLLTHYPENYFSHIVIDECHRSAWGKWSQVLTRNPLAFQVGLTATPRRLDIREDSKEARADAFTYKQTSWLKSMPDRTSAVIRAIAGQFAKAGTEGLENPAVFQTPDVVHAGGLAALKAIGKPSKVLTDTKERMFEA